MIKHFENFPPKNDRSHGHLLSILQQVFKLIREQQKNKGKSIIVQSGNSWDGLTFFFNLLGDVAPSVSTFILWCHYLTRPRDWKLTHTQKLSTTNHQKLLLNKHNAELQRKPSPANQSNTLYARWIIRHSIFWDFEIQIILDKNF